MPANFNASATATVASPTPSSAATAAAANAAAARAAASSIFPAWVHENKVTRHMLNTALWTVGAHHMDDADQFHISVRKAMLCCIPGMCILTLPAFLWCGLYVANRNIPDADKPTDEWRLIVASMVVAVLVTGFEVGIGIYCRFTGNFSERMWLLGMAVMGASHAYFSITTKCNPTHLKAAVFATTVAAGRAPTIPATLLTLLMALTIVQQICAEVFGYDKFMLPGYHGRPGNAADMYWEEDLIIRFLGVQVFLLGSIIVAVGALRTSLQQRRLEGAAQLSSTLAAYSRRYDTDAMREALDAYELDASCDEELLATQRAVLRNLETFRPHLPHFVLLQLQSETTATTNDDDESSDDADAFGDGARRHGRDVTAKRAGGESVSGLSSCDAGGGGGGTTPESSSAWGSRGGSTVSARGPGGLQGRSPSVSQLQRPARSVPRRGRGTLDQRLEQLAGAAVTYTGKVTYVSLLLHHVAPAAALGRTGAKTALAVCAAVDSFLQAAAVAAEAQRGSLLYSVGDTILCAWNATGRTALPAVKACAFLASLQDPARLLTLQLQAASSSAAAGATQKRGGKLRTAISVDAENFGVTGPASESFSPTASTFDVSAAAVTVDNVAMDAYSPVALAAAVSTQLAHCFFAGNSRRRFFTTIHGGDFSALCNALDRTALEFAAFAAATGPVVAPCSGSMSSRALAAGPSAWRPLRVVVDAGTHEAAQFAHTLWPLCVARDATAPFGGSSPKTLAPNQTSPDQLGEVLTAEAPTSGSVSTASPSVFSLFYELGPHSVAAADGRADDNEWMYQLEARATAAAGGPDALSNRSFGGLVASKASLDVPPHHSGPTQLQQQQQQLPQESSPPPRAVLTATARAVAAFYGAAPHCATAAGSKLLNGPVDGTSAHSGAHVPSELLSELRAVVARLAAHEPSPQGVVLTNAAAAATVPEAAACGFFIRSVEQLESSVRS